jgi:hypothetical protein
VTAGSGASAAYLLNEAASLVRSGIATSNSNLDETPLCFTGLALKEGGDCELFSQFLR